jgi:hypothetical protein
VEMTDPNYIIENKLIVLNSNDAIKLNGEYLSNVNFPFTDILKKDTDILYTSCALLTAEIPVSFYNININNFTLYFSINDITYSISLDEGNYNATNFITEFVSKFNAGLHGHTISMSFNKISGKLTTTKLTGVYDIIYLAENSSIYGVLGFLDDTDYTITSSLIHAYMLNLLGVKTIKIYSPNLSLQNYDSNGHTSGNLIHTLSVNQPSYSMIDYHNQHNALSRLNNKTINNLEIQLRDENSNYIDFNNIPWTLSLILNIYRKFQSQDNTDLNLNSLALKIFEPQNIPLPSKNELKEAVNDLEEDNIRQLELLNIPFKK